jgi:hypothetical protein
VLQQQRDRYAVGNEGRCVLLNVNFAGSSWTAVAEGKENLEQRAKGGRNRAYMARQNYKAVFLGDICPRYAGSG